MDRMGTLLRTPLAIPLSMPLAEEAERLSRSLHADPGPHANPNLKPAPRRWDLEAVTGGIAEISGPAAATGLTAAACLILEAQKQGQPAAWIAAGDSLFYAPDLYETGADLEALPVVRVTGAVAGARAAEHLLRSGAFGLLVLDLGRCAGRATLSSAVQVRLAALCRRHRAALLLLARKPAGTPPVASLASLRAEGTVKKVAFDRFNLRLHVLKDKHRGAGWNVDQTFRGPEGLS
jgi:recombination protein RecA